MNEEILFVTSFMNRTCLLIFFLLTIFAVNDMCGLAPYPSGNSLRQFSDQDTVRPRQLLFTGKLWENEYHRIKGDQFVFSNIFMPGAVFINGRQFNNLTLKYDIYSDELLVPKNPSEIVQLNKEVVDSFSLFVDDKEFKFIKTSRDTLKHFTGYVNLVYKGKSALYVKYKKEIASFVSDLYLGEFYSSIRLFLVKGDIVFQISNPYDIAAIYNMDKTEVRHFFKKNKIKISGKNPESFKSVLEFCEGKYH